MHAKREDPVTDGKNILVGGGTGTGKTTFANALLKVVAEQTNDRLYIAEDTPELQCAAPNKVLVRTRRGEFEMRDAVFAALRLLLTSAESRRNLSSPAPGT